MSDSVELALPCWVSLLNMKESYNFKRVTDHLQFSHRSGPVDGSECICVTRLLTMLHTNSTAITVKELDSYFPESLIQNLNDNLDSHSKSSAWVHIGKTRII